MNVAKVEMMVVGEGDKMVDKEDNLAREDNQVMVVDMVV